MTKSELLELISHGENSGVEFKRDDTRPEQLAKEIAALANLQGGTVILGVEDDGAISGIQREDLELWVMDTVFGRKIHPMILPFYEEISVDATRRVAVISFTQGASKPYVVHHNDREEIYVRVGSVSRLATREQQARLFAMGGMLHTDLLPVSGSTIHDLSQQRIEDYLTNLVGDSKLPESDEAWIRRLCGLGFMSDRSSEVAVCTIAGLVLFGNNPRRFLRQAGVRWMVFDGIDKDYGALDDQVLDGPLVSHWQTVSGTDRQIVDKGLIERVADAMRPFVSQEISAIEESMQRRRLWHYPVEAIREAIVNALAHRDWTRYEEVEIVAYSNRLEINSPGALQNTMTLDKMIAGQRSPRNPLIVDALRDYGYVDARGMGVRKKIIPLLRRMNGVEPLFQANEDRLTVTLGRSAIASRGTVVTINTNELAVPAGSLAYFLSASTRGAVRLLTDAGDAMVAVEEIVVPDAPLGQFEPMRLWVPYGIWTERNGGRVLFSRDYCPLWRVLSNGRVERESPWTEIDFVESEILWSPSIAPWADSGTLGDVENLMRKYRVPKEPPILMDALPVILSGDADRIRDAVKILAPLGTKFPHFPRGPGASKETRQQD